MKGFPWEFGIGVRGPKCLTASRFVFGGQGGLVMGLPNGRKGFKIGLVVLIQYRL